MITNVLGLTNVVTMVAGRVCTPPDKATDCIHLLSAISRLPNKTLTNGYVPKCTADGKFENIQCDDSYCWCVDEKGIEIIGTKTSKKDSIPNCLRHGDIDICQMVEPDCAQPPRQPVPRYEFRPPGWITDDFIKRCDSAVYSYKPISFNGFGFCCSHPESVLHSGSCFPVSPKPSRWDESECRVDSNCSEQAKCCFDGCSLKCVLDVAHIHALRIELQSTISYRRTANCKRYKSTANYGMPTVPMQLSNLEKRAVAFKMDQDCPGVEKRCTYNYSALCLFPSKTTGNYEQIQCDGDICCCVDTINGSEIPATRTVSYAEAACNEGRLDCKPFKCQKICPYGFKFTRVGCRSCECHNPCTRLSRRQGCVCVMVSVECLENAAYCSDQPRCVSNVCSTDGLPNSSIPSVLCENEKDCPNNNIGIQSKDLCCPLPSRQLDVDAKCEYMEPIIEYNKSCDIPCLAEALGQCKTDNDCTELQKCCMTNCGKRCSYPEQTTDGHYKKVQCDRLYCWCVSKTGFELEETKVLKVEQPYCQAQTRLGECPHISQTSCLLDETNECFEDVDCRMTQKCCSNGCKKLCVYREITTACIHLLSASESFGPGSFVPQCGLSGTRALHRNLNCGFPRSCPVLNCQLDCSLENVHCPPKYVCRVVDVKCMFESCNPIPKCRLFFGFRISCFSNFGAENISVFLGYFCHQVGIPLSFSSSYCRTGNGSFITICSTTFEILSADSARCNIECRTNSECLSRKCCFNGCGTSCIDLKTEEVDRQIALSSKEVLSKGFHENKLRSCSIDEISDSSCKTGCIKDSDYPSFQKCCVKDCSSSCAFPHIATGKNLTYICRRLNGRKSELHNALIGQYFQLVFTNWHFITMRIRRYILMVREMNVTMEHSKELKKKCDQQFRQCWCVDIETGEEMFSTRAVERPCQGKSNPCQKHSKALRDRNNNVYSCALNEDCGRGLCKLLSNEQTHGICCSTDTKIHIIQIAMWNAPVIRRVLEYNCVVIIVVTSFMFFQKLQQVDCILLYGAIGKLTDSGVTVSLRTPLCNKHTGMFETVQCDNNNECWCVDVIIGTSIHGSKMKLPDSSPSFVYTCAPVRKKPALDEATYIQLPCSEKRSELCPQGYYCTGYDPAMRGVCYETNEEKPDMVSCLHGNPFSKKADGWPMDCSQSTNDCPPTHYYFRKPNQIFGMCCVSKPANADKLQVMSVVYLLMSDSAQAFREYFERKFDVEQYGLKDIIISDSNMMQFVLSGENAKLKATNISDAVSGGSFRFTCNGNIYRAEPHSWTSHHITEKKALGGALFLYGKRSLN
uniref:Thyroglobulin type-1 domain-containing protein n=1 Tax=Setaria digitata TaxID=48799 RepID=A0A915PTR1_9BILA